ncbi:right-handed parallel beta-helix repeat-containing protein [Candidatus Sumerlaeota bacterium]|nr:right-handed parallel beta-helix repeat-containing protein [Candidatus Sumerlaeota bacterium]
MKRFIPAIIGFLLVVLLFSANAENRVLPDMIDVRDMGAAGDGTTDDTKAFQKAVERAKIAKMPVFVPRGKYRISGAIEIEETALTGPPAPAWPADVDTLPSILPAHTDKPAFHLLAGGSICGIDITYNWKDQPTTGPPAILISGIGVTVRDTRIRYAWDGIIADGKSNTGRTNLENIFMVSIMNVGVRMTGTWDVPRLNNIEVWNAGAQDSNRGLTYGIGFHLGKNDLIRMTDCFVFGMHYGFLLESKIDGCEIEGDTWGVMNGCSTDFCGLGIVVRGNHTLSVSGGTFWDHASGLVLEQGTSRVRVSGCEMSSNGAPAVVIRECDHAVISGCSLLRPMEGFSSPAVLLEGGKIVLGSNYIESKGPGVQITPNADSAVIHGNMIKAHGGKTIINHSKIKSNILDESNQSIE